MQLPPYGMMVKLIIDVFVFSLIRRSYNNLFFIGLICATFTDLKVLSGPYTHKCFYWYGCSRSRVPAHQEVLKIGGKIISN